MKAQQFVSISMNFLMISPHWSESVLTLITRLDLIQVGHSQGTQEVLYSDAQILASPFDVLSSAVLGGLHPLSDKQKDAVFFICSSFGDYPPLMATNQGKADRMVSW